MKYKNQLQRTILFIAFLLTMTNCSDLDDNLKEPDNTVILPKETIKKGSELFTLIERVVTDEANPLTQIVCVDFVYPLSLYLYDANFQVTGSVTIETDWAFSDFLGSLPDNQLISISYPIMTTLSDGTPFSVNNNSELKLAIDNCSREDVISYCNGIFSGFNPTTPNTNCYSFVRYSETGLDNKYVSGAFEINVDGHLKFHYNGVVYNGSWQFLFVENSQLHLNINLEGSSSIATDWNIDRPIYFADGNIVIDNPDPQKDVMLTKTCQVTETYEVGDMGPAHGIVFYDKGSYSEGWRYAEVSNFDLATAEWGCSGSSVANANSAAIGRGYGNTAAIVNFHDALTNYYTNPAVCNVANNGTVMAKNSLLYSIIGFKDWFLPSETELKLVYDNLHVPGLGNMENATYWTSTEVDATQAKAIDFSSGNSIPTAKITAPNTVKARAIRYF